MKNRLTKTCSIFIALMFFSFIFAPVAIGKPLRVNAVSAIAIDGNTGIVLFEQNGHKVIPMASTTKIITALVVLKYGDLDKQVEISKNAAAIRGSKVGYKSGEKITLRELLYGLMLRSGNDCAIAIAEGMSGSIENFCKLMNEYALEIGLVDSHFESPHGLDSIHHYSSSYDLAIATKKAKEVKEFNDIVSAKVVDGNAMGFTRSFNNINKILFQIPEANGVKTGYTGQAGKCLVSSVRYDSSDIIIVTLNCTERWKETKRIYEYVKENYTYQKVVSKDEVVGELSGKNAVDKVQLVTSRDIVIPVKNDVKIEKEIIPKNSSLTSNVKDGDKVGMLIIKANDEVLLKEQLITKGNYKTTKFRDIIKKFIKD